MARLGDHHKDQLLKVLGCYMSQELRQKLMLECPAAYNAWMREWAGLDNDVVRVHHTSDNRPVVPDVIAPTEVIIESEHHELVRLAGKIVARFQSFSVETRTRFLEETKSDLSYGGLCNAVTHDDVEYLLQYGAEIRKLAKGLETY
jgi:hypothetical protein